MNYVGQVDEIESLISIRQRFSGGDYKLGRYELLGPGIVGRVAAETQRKYFAAPSFQSGGSKYARVREARSYVLAVGMLEICGYLLYLGSGPLFTNDAKSLWPDTTLSSGNSSSSTALHRPALAVARMIASDW